MKQPLEVSDRIATPILYGLVSALTLALIAVIVTASATLSGDALIGGLAGLATGVVATSLWCTVPVVRRQHRKAAFRDSKGSP